MISEFMKEKQGRKLEDYSLFSSSDASSKSDM